ncbi:hypothetical protein Q8F55_004503 [Vanrija albida]|uniref:AB hydrolase-1 domain-containing protein n=1 Tax=Vanrija albida TaxID=181172 RepID=A0ABR3Q6Y1_9TREE
MAASRVAITTLRARARTAAAHGYRPLSTAASSSTDSQTITLPDGRTLGYATYGSTKPSDPTLFYFHGYPSCRLEGEALDQIAQKHGLRVVTPDRPGSGLSTVHPTSTSGPPPKVTDYPADMTYLADHLGVGKFAVIGGSGGGPAALACGADPSLTSRLTTVGLFAAAPPWEAGRQYMSRGRRWLAWGAERVPWLVTLGTNGLLAIVRFIVRRKYVQNKIDAFIEAQAAKAREAGVGGNGTREAGVGGNGTREAGVGGNGTREAGVGGNGTREAGVGGNDTRPMSEQRDALIRMLTEPFAQGAAPIVYQTQLLVRPWGIDYGTIPFQPVRIWHGTKDTASPVVMMRWLAERIPGSQMTEWDEGHYGLLKYLDEILKEVVDKAKEAEARDAAEAHDAAEVLDKKT